MHLSDIIISEYERLDRERQLEINQIDEAYVKANPDFEDLPDYSAVNEKYRREYLKLVKRIDTPETLVAIAEKSSAAMTNLLESDGLQELRDVVELLKCKQLVKLCQVDKSALLMKHIFSLVIDDERQELFKISHLLPLAAINPTIVAFLFQYSFSKEKLHTQLAASFATITQLLDLIDCGILANNQELIGQVDYFIRQNHKQFIRLISSFEDIIAVATKNSRIAISLAETEGEVVSAYIRSREHIEEIIKAITKNNLSNPVMLIRINHFFRNLSLHLQNQATLVLSALKGEPKESLVEGHFFSYGWKKNQSQHVSLEQKIHMLFEQNCRLNHSPYLGIYIEFTPGTQIAVINQCADLIKSAGIAVEVTQESKMAALMLPGKLAIRGETIETFDAKITALLERFTNQNNISAP